MRFATAFITWRRCARLSDTTNQIPAETHMDNVTSRRTVLKTGLTAAGLAAFGIPEWAVPALAEGETPVPFTDIPANFATNPSEVVRVLDIRKIDNGPTPKDQFFTTQHYGHPSIDPAAFRLKITGLVDRPKTLSVDEIKAMGRDAVAAAFECSGNGRGRVQGFASNEIGRASCRERGER